MASPWGTAIGQVVQPKRLEVPSLPVRLAPRPVFLAAREGLLAELDTRLAGAHDRVNQAELISEISGAGH